jgi:hypothetical protein
MKDSGDEIASCVAVRTNHDDEASFAHVFHMMAKIDGFLCRSSQSDHGSLEVGQEAMLGSARIETMQTFLSVKDVDVISGNPGAKQILDGRARSRGIDEGADDPIRRIRDEVTWMMRHKSFRR